MYKAVRTRTGEAPPWKLYKFMAKQYVDDFLNGKVAWIGTLHDFRDLEKHKLGKGDPMEGMLHISKDGMWSRQDPEMKAFYGQLDRRGWSIEGKFQNNGVDVVVNHPDCFVFCASLEFDEAIATGLDDGYDCCVEIGNAPAFIEAMMKGFTLPIDLSGTKFQNHTVIYKNKVTSPAANSFSNSPFLKSEHFAFEKEYRLVWMVPGNKKAGPLAPFGIKVDMSKVNARIIWPR